MRAALQKGGQLRFLQSEDMMYTSSEILEKVNQALTNLPLDRQPANLYKPVEYVLSLGGKRIRPVLMLMAYNLYREDVENCMAQALGVETYHNFTLLHDDLMDKADVRRGKPCVHKIWNDNQAILSGDTMLVLAAQMVASGCSPRKGEVLDIFLQTAIEIDEGQQFDIDFETREDVREEEYIEMVRLKTSVLLACALKIGATMADAPSQDTEALYRFGEKLGVAFQLQDDFLDVYGDYKTFGKRIGGDILCNKKTYMLINALRLASPEQRAELQKWLAATEYDEEEKIQAVTRLYTAVGVDKLALQAIDAYFREAEKELALVNLTEEKKKNLWGLALQLMGRKS